MSVPANMSVHFYAGSIANPTSATPPPPEALCRRSLWVLHMLEALGLLSRRVVPLFGESITSWRNKTTSGQRSERTARGDAPTSWRDKTTRGRRNERTTRGDATTSWHDKTTPGRRDERRHNLIVFRVQTEATGQVTAMAVARIK